MLQIYEVLLQSPLYGGKMGVFMVILKNGERHFKVLKICIFG